MKTLEEIQRANPDLKAGLANAARRCVPASFRDDGEPVYSEENLITAAKVMSGRASSRETKGAGPGVEYR